MTDRLVRVVQHTHHHVSRFPGADFAGLEIRGVDEQGQPVRVHLSSEVLQRIVQTLNNQHDMFRIPPAP
jgi:hypothetical protein